MDNLYIDSWFFLTVLVAFGLYYVPALRRLQLVIVSATSLFIYGYIASEFMVILLASVLITTVASFYLATQARHRKTLLVLGIGLNLVLLAFFKYKHLLFPAGTFPASWEHGAAWNYVTSLALPIGISFYVFHGISLMVDTYRDRAVIDDAHARPRFLKHLLKTTHFISFFPQVVAGPIAKGKHFYTQIEHKKWRDIDWESAITALGCGYFMKEVIANNLSQFTQFMSMSDRLTAMNGQELLWIMLGYSAQIFADFAGYSLIAIGLARLFGYALPRNFNWPYLASSFSDFWQRWHISLSSWLRDYLYIPLGGNRRGAVRLGVNLMIVMGLGGLWHGAEWRYAIWGLMHGGLLVAERMLANLLPEHIRSPKHRVLRYVLLTLRIIFVFSAVTVAWLFFRMPTAADAWNYLSLIYNQWNKGYSGYHLELLHHLVKLTLVLHILGVLYHRYTPQWGWMNYAKPVVLGLLLLLAMVAKGPETAFIYFQF